MQPLIEHANFLPQKRQNLRFEPRVSFSQPVLRQDGCGSGSTSARSAGKQRRQFRTVSVSSRRAGAEMPALGVETDGQHQLDLRHQRHPGVRQNGAHSRRGGRSPPWAS